MSARLFQFLDNWKRAEMLVVSSLIDVLRRLVIRAKRGQSFTLAFICRALCLFFRISAVDVKAK